MWESKSMHWVMKTGCSGAGLAEWASDMGAV